MISRGQIRSRAPAFAGLLTALLSAVLCGSLPSASFATTPTPTPTRPAAILAFESDPNDYLGAGQAKVFTDADGVFVAIHEPGLVLVDFVGAESYWLLDFKAPRRGELLPGVYEGASNGLGITNPRLQIIGEGRFCSVLSGRFVVLEAAYAPNGDVERFAVDFELHCHFKDPIFFGYLRIGSKIPAPPRRTATPTPEPDSFVLQIDSDREDPVGRGYRGTVRADEGPVVAQYFLYPWADWRPHLNLGVKPIPS